MTQGGLETLAEYGRALSIKPPLGEIKEKAFFISNLRRVANIAGTPESDWLLAERALFANLWVDHVIPVVPGTSYISESIEQQITKLAHAIREKQPRKYEPHSPENWILAAQMIGQRTYEGRIIVNHNLLIGF